MNFQNNPPWGDGGGIPGMDFNPNPNPNPGFDFNQHNQSGVMGPPGFRRPPSFGPTMFNDDDDSDSPDVDKIAYWSVERESPQFCYDPKTGKKKEISGVLQDLSGDKYSASTIVDYIKKTFGGGSYIVYGCNHQGRQIENRPITIPMLHPTLDGNGKELILEIQEDDDDREENNYMAGHTYPNRLPNGEIVQGAQSMAHVPANFNVLGNSVEGTYRANVDMLKDSIEQKSNTIESLQKELNNMRAHYTQHEAELKNSHQRELSQLKEELSNYKEHYLKSSGTERAQHQAELAKTRESYQEEISKLRENLSTLTTTLNNKIENINRDKDQAVRDITIEKDSQIRDLTEKLRNTERDLRDRHQSQLREEMRDWEHKKLNEIRDIETRKNEERRSIEENYRREIEVWKKENQEIKLQNATLSQKLSSKELEIERIQNEWQRKEQLAVLDAKSQTQAERLQSQIEKMRESSQTDFQKQMLAYFMSQADKGRTESPFAMMKEFMEIQNQMQEMSMGGLGGLDDLDEKEPKEEGVLGQIGKLAGSLGPLFTPQQQTPQFIPMPMMPPQQAPWPHPGMVPGGIPGAAPFQPVNRMPQQAPAPQPQQAPQAPPRPQPQPQPQPRSPQSQINNSQTNPGGATQTQEGAPIQLPPEFFDQIMQGQEGQFSKEDLAFIQAMQQVHNEVQNSQQGSPQNLQPQPQQPQVAPQQNPGQPQMQPQLQGHALYANVALKEWLKQGLSEYKDAEVWAKEAVKYLTDEGKLALLELEEEKELVDWLENAGINPLEFIQVLVNPMDRNWVDKAVTALQEVITDEFEDEDDD